MALYGVDPKWHYRDSKIEKVCLMEIFLALAIAFICASMAKKRGRGPVKWFFLGLFLNVFALIALALMGNADGYSPNLVSQYGSPSAPFPTYSSPNTAQPTFQQSGQVDLNSLRDAVRGNSQSSATQNPGSGTYSSPQDAERLNFQRHIDGMLTTLVYPNVPAGTNQLLKQMWSRLGKNLVDSGLAGGVNDDYEFYVVLENGTPVFFAPFSFDGSPGLLSVQFGLPVKRFASAPQGLEQWAVSQPARQSVEATLVATGSGMEQVLWAMASYQPHQVTDQSLYALCSAVFNEAIRIRDTVPKKFGGIVVIAN